MICYTKCATRFFCIVLVGTVGLHFFKVRFLLNSNEISLQSETRSQITGQQSSTRTNIRNSNVQKSTSYLVNVLKQQKTNDLEINRMAGHPKFQTRNHSELTFRLAGVRKLLEPFVKKTEKISDELKKLEIQWQPVNAYESPVVVNGYEEGYFKKITHLQIKTIIVNVKKEEIFKYLFGHAYDHTGSNCSQMESSLMHPLTKNSEFHYGAKCVPLNDSLHPVPFHDNAFRLGMPANYTIQQNGQVVLTFLHVTRNAIATPEGDVHVANLKIVPQRCLQSLRPIKPRAIPSVTDEEVFTISQFYGSAYYHAITENLSRLSPWLGFLKKHKHVKIHVTSRNGFMQRMFKSLGLDPSRMITGIRRVKILYMPPASTCGRSIAFNGQLLSLQFRQAMKTSPEPRKSIVVIKRSAKRFFKKHDKICQMIEKVVQGTDIKVEIFSDKDLPTLEGTIAIFNRAFMVIGPRGAGETNLFFSEEGTINLEGQCIIHGTVNLCYRNLMRVLGHRYYGLHPDRDCKDTTPEQLEETVRQYMNDLYLNISAV